MCDSFQDTKERFREVLDSQVEIPSDDASNKAVIEDLNEDQQLEYDDFLREMAGSWQAPDSDDEEDEEEEAINEQEYADFLREFAGSWEATPSEVSDEEEDDWVHVGRPNVGEDRNDDSDKDKPAEGKASSSNKKICTTACSTRTPSVAGSEEPSEDMSEEEKEAEVDDNGWAHLACYGTNLDVAEKEKLALLACGDGPVEDGYDVCQAITDYAEQRPGTAEEHRRLDMQASIDMDLRQAEQLWRRIENSQDKSVVTHYSQVCAELLVKVARLRFELSLEQKNSGNHV